MIQKAFKKLSILVSVLFLLWVALYLAFQTETVQKWALKSTLALIEKKSDAHVSVERIEIIFPLSIRLYNLSVSFDTEPALKVGQLDISIFSPALLKKDPTIQSIYAKNVYLGSGLIPDEGINSKEPQEGDEKSFSPVFNIKDLAIENLTIDPSIISRISSNPDFTRFLESSAFSVDGFFDINGLSNDLNAQLAIIISDQHATRSPVYIDLEAFKGQLSFSLHSKDFSIKQAGLKNSFEQIDNLDLFLEGSGSTAAWMQLAREGKTSSDLTGSYEIESKSSVAPFKVSSRYSLNSLSDLKFHDILLHSLEMSVKGSARIDGSKITAQLESEHLIIENQEFNHVTTSVDADLMNSDVNASVNISFQYNELPVTAKSTLIWNIGETVQFKELELDIMEKVLNGHLGVNLSNADFEGYLEGNELQFNGLKAKNSLISFHKNDSIITITGALKTIQSPHVSAHEFLFESQIDLNNRFHPFQLKASIDDRSNLAAAGHWNHSNNKLQLQVESATGQLLDEPVELNHPFEIFHGKDLTETSELNLSIGKGVLKSALKTDWKTITLHSEVIDIPSDTFESFFPNIPFSGEPTLIADIHGSIDNPEAKILFDVSDLKIHDAAYDKIPLAKASFEINIGDSKASFDGQIIGISPQPISAQGIVPVRFSIYPAIFDIDKESPIDVDLRAKGDVVSFLSLFLEQTTTLTGDAEVAVKVKGTFDTPNILGEISLLRGSYENISTGLIYRNIEAHLEGNGSQIELKSLSLTDDKNGTISATGSGTLDSTQNFPFEVQLNASHISILDSDFSKISVSGPLVLTGNTQKGKLTGNLQLDQALINIGEETPTSIKTVDVTYINVPEGSPPPNYTQNREEKWPLELDVHVNTPGEVKIKGSNLKSVWKGDITITGTVQNILLNGDLKVVDGSFDLRGKIFEISQGNIHFAGPISKKTTLYIVATKEIEKITAEIIVKGSTQNPVFSFRSNPPLSEREVLSYILFNRGTSDITPDQGVQLKQSFMELSATSGASDDFLTKMRNNIGLDRLDFAGGDSATDEFSLQLGKYISKGVLVGINKGLNAGANRVTIEAELRKNLKAQAEVGDDGQSRLLLKWKKSY